MSKSKARWLTRVQPRTIWASNPHSSGRLSPSAWTEERDKKDLVLANTRFVIHGEQNETHAGMDRTVRLLNEGRIA